MNYKLTAIVRSMATYFGCDVSGANWPLYSVIYISGSSQFLFTTQHT